MTKLTATSGYSLFELIVVIVIIGVIATVAMKSLSTGQDISRTEETLAEMDELAHAISGDPNKRSGGQRTDFGYVGDIGALPPSLTALVTNPGLGTWDGPYIRDDFYAASGASETEYSYDAWGANYTLNATSVASTGSGETLTREFAASSNALLNNIVSVTILDLDLTPPGMTWRDSLVVIFRYPDGAGSMTAASGNPATDGVATFTGVPIGIHNLDVVFVPAADTISRRVVVNPGEDCHTEVILGSNLFAGAPGGGSGGGPSPSPLALVPGTPTVTGGSCNEIEFEVINNSSSTIDINSLTVTTINPAAYYAKVKIGGTAANENTPRHGAGDEATFNNPESFAPGQIKKVQLEKWYDSPSGGSRQDMSNATLTVSFSDGSTVTLSPGACN